MTILFEKAENVDKGRFRYYRYWTKTLCIVLIYAKCLSYVAVAKLTRYISVIFSGQSSSVFSALQGDFMKPVITTGIITLLL